MNIRMFPSPMGIKHFYTFLINRKYCYRQFPSPMGIKHFYTWFSFL